MSTQITHFSLSLYWIIPTILIGSFILMSSHPVQAETIITNSVSVSTNSSNGNSSNRASVTTIIDGKIVEDWSASSTEPIIHTSNFTDSDTGNTVQSTNINSSDSLEKDRLQALITQLEALISFYVLLLHR